MNQKQPPSPTLWSLRPAGEHAALRRLLQAKGLRLRALSTVRLLGRPADEGLTRALAADLRVFTSPAAVRFAAKLAVLSESGPINIAVGEGTARALRAAGVQDPIAPVRMDSEGVLALPALVQLQGKSVGLFTAPGGRGLLPTALEERGARVCRADVYARLALPLKARTLGALADDDTAILLASSTEALGHLRRRLAHLAPLKRDAVLARPLVVSSARLGLWAKEQGFQQVLVAENARPEALCHAALSLVAGRSLK